MEMDCTNMIQLQCDKLLLHNTCHTTSHLLHCYKNDFIHTRIYRLNSLTPVCRCQLLGNCWKLYCSITGTELLAH